MNKKWTNILKKSFFYTFFPKNKFKKKLEKIIFDRLRLFLAHEMIGSQKLNTFRPLIFFSNFFLIFFFGKNKLKIWKKIIVDLFILFLADEKISQPNVSLIRDQLVNGYRMI